MRRLSALLVVLLLWCAPAQAAIAVVVSAAAGAGTGVIHTATTAGINTTGANLIVAVATNYAGSAQPTTMSDSRSLSWTSRTLYEGIDLGIQVFYAANPTVGAAHTFTATNFNGYPSVAVIAFSGAATAAPYDVENGAVQASGTTVSTGSVTPSANNEVLVTGLVHGDPTVSAASIDSSFTVSNQVAYASGDHIGIAMAYKIQTTAGAENPQWTWMAAGAGAGSIATFKVAPVGGTAVCKAAVLGVGC